MKTSVTSTLLLSAMIAAAQNPETTDSIPGLEVDLADFEIVATRPIVQSDGAKLTYNMEEDPSSKGNSLIDALKKVPMLSVDGEDNIRLNGESNFIIYVNGKEDPSLTANYKNIFKAMPAEAVTKIEVITEPGAKYDAEGTAGIINLITISKNTTNGFSGTISTTFSKKQTGGSFYGQLRKGKLALAANVDYANGWIFKQKSTSDSNTEFLGSPIIAFQNDKGAQSVGFQYVGTGLHLSYDLSDKDLLTADATYYLVNGKVTKGSFFSSAVYDPNNSLITFLHRALTGKVENSGVNAGAAWQHQLDEEGQKFILSYLFNYGLNNLDAGLTLDEHSRDITVSPFERNILDNYTREHTVQADYIKPFNEDRHTLEAGAKTIWRRNDAISTYHYGNNSADAEATANRSDLTQKQDIYAIYAAWAGSFGNFKTSAGVRYEHTDMGIDFHWGPFKNFMNGLDDVVPNASVSFQFTPASNLRASYQMRISRPSLNSINPYRLSFNSNQVQMGNPDLESEKSNKISLTYTNFGTVFGGNVGIEYSAINNAISSYSFVEDDIIYDTYANIGKDRRFSAFGYLSWNIIPRMQFSLNARLSYINLKADSQNLSNSGWNINYGANWNYALISGFKFNIYGGQQTRTHNLQGTGGGWFYYGLGISKNFLRKDALTITLSASDFLQGRQKFKSTTITEFSRQNNVWTNENWNLGISLSWNFGTLNSNVKKAAKSISNDDQTSVGQKTGNGI